MNPKTALIVSSCMFIIMIIVSFFLNVEVFTRAEGEVISFTPPVYSDFAGEGVLSAVYISEGDVVEKGQVIAELNNEELKINLDIFINNKTQIDDKIKILSSLLEDHVDVEGISNKDVLSDQLRRFNLVKYNYMENKKNLEMLVAVDGKKSRAMTSLVKKNAIGSMLSVESMQKLLSDKKDLLSSKKEFEDLVVFEIERYEEVLRNVKNNIRLYRYYIEKSYVRAPVSGIIRYVHEPQEGKFISKGDSFAEIIESAAGKFKVQLNVSAVDIGMIEVDSDVRIRIDTYDHSVFGIISGTISSVSVDRLNEENNELYYRVEVIPDTDYLFNSDQVYPLKYGMTLYGTIERGTVSFMTYFMMPVIKHFNEIGHI